MCFCILFLLNNLLRPIPEQYYLIFFLTINILCGLENPYDLVPFLENDQFAENLLYETFRKTSAHPMISANSNFPPGTEEYHFLRKDDFLKIVSGFL